MTNKRSGRGLVVMGVLVTLCTDQREGLCQQATKEPAKPSAGVIVAWQKAGGEFGYLSEVPWGQLDWRHASAGRPDDLPSFTFRSARTFKDLPPPEVPFGIRVHSKPDNAAMKQLAAFKHLHSLSLWASPLTDVELKTVGELKQLRRLVLPYVSAAKATDIGLSELARLSDLEWLDLSASKLTDEGMKELAKLKGLKTLILGATGVTDASAKELAQLKELQTLSLRETKVGDATLKELAMSKRMKTLDLARTNVTDVGVKELTGLKELELFNLEKTQVTGAGLGSFTSLRWLNLAFNKVRDEALKELAGLKGLRQLQLDGTQVTDQGIEELRRALPHAGIRRSR